MRYFRENMPPLQPISGLSVLVRYLGFPGWQVLPIGVEEEGVEEDPLAPVLSQRFTGKPASQGLFCDAYRLREEFFKLTTLEEWRDFLTDAGPLTRVDDQPPFPDGSRGTFNSLGDCMSWQTYLRCWQLEGYGCVSEVPYTSSDNEEIGVQGNLNWLVSPSTRFSLDGKTTSPLIAFIECHSVVEAVAATIQLDLLRGIRWRKCLACDEVFEFTDQRKLYCGHECAHREGQKRRRSMTKV